MRQCAILVGGLGTRLGALTADKPKPLVDVGGRPFLDYLIDEAVRHGLRDILLLAGHRAEAVAHWAAAAGRPGVSLTTFVEPEPWGTGGALRMAATVLDEAFLLMNGDSLFDLNLLDLATAEPSGALATLALKRVADNHRYGTVSLEGTFIRAFNERPDTPGPGLVNGGVYRLRRAILDAIGSLPCSIERDVFPRLAARGELHGRVYERPLLDIGVPDALAAAQTVIPAMTRRGALFLDRDGVMIEDTGYPHRPADVRWIAGTFEAIKAANDAGLLVLVVTNQAGVARGYYGEEEVRALHAWMAAELARYGAHVDEFVYCPHHPTEGIGAYRVACSCRKPEPGMLLDLMQRWRVDPARSLLVGDKPSDLAAARAAGIEGRLFTAPPLSALVAPLLSPRG